VFAPNVTAAWLKRAVMMGKQAVANSLTKRGPAVWTCQRCREVICPDDALEDGTL
jgi:hypothetical protein